MEFTTVITGDTTDLPANLDTGATPITVTTATAPTMMATATITEGKIFMANDRTMVTETTATGAAADIAAIGPIPEGGVVLTNSSDTDTGRPFPGRSGQAQAPECRPLGLDNQHIRHCAVT